MGNSILSIGLIVVLLYFVYQIGIYFLVKRMIADPNFSHKVFSLHPKLLEKEKTWLAEKSKLDKTAQEIRELYRKATTDKERFEIIKNAKKKLKDIV